MSDNTIRISEEVYRGLQDIQLPRESYGAAIARLLVVYHENKKRRRRRGEKEVEHDHQK